MHKLLIVSFMLFIVLLSSCKKDNEHEPANILLSKTWKYGMVDKNQSSNPPGRVLYYAVLNCEKDDTCQFSSNGTLKISRGADKCESSEAISETVSYAYDKSSKELTIDGTKYKLAEESGSQIKYYAPLPYSTNYEYMVFLLQ